MAFIEIFDGSFPAQSAMFLKKSAFVQQAALTLKDSDKKQVIYNIRNAVQSLEIITPDNKKPGIKITLKDGKIIVARADRKTIEDIQLIIAAGPDEEGSLFIVLPQKKAKERTPPHPMVSATRRFVAWVISLICMLLGVSGLVMEQWYVGGAFMALAIIIVPPGLAKFPFLSKAASVANAPVPKNAMLALYGIIGLLLVGLVFVKGPEPSKTVRVSPPKPQYKSATETDARLIAGILCVQRVKAGLRAPRTAKFPWSHEVTFKGRTATLVSYVDAENAFGAMIRTHYVCTVDYIGGDPSETSNWQLTDVAMLD